MRDYWQTYLGHSGSIVGFVLAFVMVSGCASWRSPQQDVARPSPPMQSQFRRDASDKPHYFFDEKAREIEASLGVGGQPSGF